jgi:hypothetical protein
MCNILLGRREERENTEEQMKEENESVNSTVY